MLKFRDFLDLQLPYAELFAEGVIEDLEAHQPKDGRWKQPPSSSGQSEYVFNVAGEEDCTEYSPCYSVKFYGSQSGSSSISFSREGSYDDTSRMNHIEVIRGVLKAITAYVKSTNPIGLDWTPVSKSKKNDRTGDFVNPNARETIYRGWAIRHLFPEKYVGGIQFPGNDENLWIRRNVYDKIFVPLGMPPIPDDISDESPSGLKLKTLESLNRYIKERFGSIPPDEMTNKK